MKRFPTFTVIALAAILVFILVQRLMGGGTSLSPEAFVAAYEPDQILLDERTPGEFEDGHLAGAINMNVTSGDFRERAATLPIGEPVYVYCASGVRSSRAAAVLEELGHAEVYNVGGYGELARAGAATEE